MRCVAGETLIEFPRPRQQDHPGRAGLHREVPEALGGPPARDGRGGAALDVPRLAGDPEGRARAGRPLPRADPHPPLRESPTSRRRCRSATARRPPSTCATWASCARASWARTASGSPESDRAILKRGRGRRRPLPAEQHEALLRGGARWRQMLGRRAAARARHRRRGQQQRPRHVRGDGRPPPSWPNTRPAIPPPRPRPRCWRWRPWAARARWAWKTRSGRWRRASARTSSWSRWPSPALHPALRRRLAPRLRGQGRGRAPRGGRGPRGHARPPRCSPSTRRAVVARGGRRCAPQVVESVPSDEEPPGLACSPRAGTRAAAGSTRCRRRAWSRCSSTRTGARWSRPPASARAITRAAKLVARRAGGRRARRSSWARAPAGASACWRRRSARPPSAVDPDAHPRRDGGRRGRGVPRRGGSGGPRRRGRARRRSSLRRATCSSASRPAR